MPQPKLATDVTKDHLTEWLSNALKCELFPNEGDSIGNVELPAFERVGHQLATRAAGDETHVITLTKADGQVFSILVKYGDYAQTKQELSRGEASP